MFLNSFFIFLFFLRSLLSNGQLTGLHYEMTNDILPSMKKGNGIEIYNFRSLGDEFNFSCVGISYQKEGKEFKAFVDNCERLFALIYFNNIHLSNDFYISEDFKGRECITHKIFNIDDCFLLY